MSVVMRKARPRRPSIQYSKEDSSAPAVGQEESPASGPGGGGGGGGWGSSDDDSARWAAANAAVRTSAAIFFLCSRREINENVNSPRFCVLFCPVVRVRATTSIS